MESLKRKIEKIIQPIISENNVELIELEIKGSRQNLIVRIFVDRPGGIQINDCVKLNRLFGEVMEIENCIPGKYRLEVSSPGIDRPLKTARDFQRNIGRLVDIKYFSEPDELSSVSGKIIEANEKTVTISGKKNTQEKIYLDCIKKALIQIQWS